MAHTKLARVGVAFIASLVAAATFALAGASPAAAQGRPHIVRPVPHQCPDFRWFNGDHSRRGTFTAFFVVVHNGPAARCPASSVGMRGDQVWFHCWKESSDGRTWSHIRYFNRRNHRYYQGWARDDFLSGYGAFTHC